MVRFERRVDGIVVGAIQQGVTWKDKKRLTKNGNL